MINTKEIKTHLVKIKKQRHKNNFISKKVLE
jgi:hypothetical protein